MRFTTAVALRACICAGTLLLACAAGTAEKSAAIGATRAEVLALYGEPRSVMVAGNRELMWYEGQRLVLRDGVVIEVNPLAPEPVRPPEPTRLPAAAPASSGASASPIAPGAGELSAPAEDSAAAESVPAPVSAAAPAAPPEPQFTIKSVRPPTRRGTRTEPAASAGTRSSVAAGPTPPPPAPVSATTLPLAGSAVLDTAVASVNEPDASLAPEPTPESVVSPEQDLPALATKPAGVEPPSEAAESAPSQEPPTTSQPAASVPAAAPATTARPAETVTSVHAGETAHTGAPVAPTDSAGAGLTRRSYFILALIAGGLGYLAWRFRQRRLELAASAVSRTPFVSTQPSSGAIARFTPELVTSLEWKRFEELVASYYGKTGVVAVRTKSGPDSPVHIKISWKGEPRPFACVQCIAHPPGLVGAKPLEDLVAANAAEEIRRGYVVTTGKFSVAARDFAEEKHLTLLSGDLLIEKLNALPDTARAELMQEIMAGDCTTPSCPKCEAKMVRLADDPSVWHCAKHSDVTIAAWK